MMDSESDQPVELPLEGGAVSGNIGPLPNPRNDEFRNESSGFAALLQEGNLTPEIGKSDLSTPLMLESLMIEEDTDDNTNPYNDMSRGGQQPFLTLVKKFAILYALLHTSYWLLRRSMLEVIHHNFHPTYHNPDGGFSFLKVIGPVSHGIVAVMVGSAAVKLRKGAVIRDTDEVPAIWLAPVAIMGFLAGKFARKGIDHSTFTVFAIFAHLRIIPVMMVTTWVVGTLYSRIQYLEAIIIFVGLTVFSLQAEMSAFGFDTDFWGFVLLLLYVSCEGVGFPWIQMVLDKFGRHTLDPFDLLLKISYTSTIVSFVELMFSSEEMATVTEFIRANPSAILETIWSAILTTANQTVILTMVREFGPVVTVTVIVTQPMFFQCITRTYPIPAFCYVGAVIVAAVVAVQVRRAYLNQFHVNNRETVLSAQQSAPILLSA